MQEEHEVVGSPHWTSMLEERVRVSREVLRMLTQRQVHDSRKEMDRRARHAFENEHKGPSKFTGKQGRSQQPEMLRWAVPVGLQWVSRGGEDEKARVMERAQVLRQKHPGAMVTVESGEVCVAVVPIQGQSMEKAGQRVREACATWAARYVERNQLIFIEEMRRVIEVRGLTEESQVDLQALAHETAWKVTRKASQHDGEASIGTAGLRGENELRWSSHGPHARRDMELWLEHLTALDSTPTPFLLKWTEAGLSITHPSTEEDTELDGMAASNAVRVEAASGMEKQRCAVASSITQDKRRDPSQSQGTSRRGDVRPRFHSE